MESNMYPEWSTSDRNKYQNGEKFRYYTASHYDKTSAEVSKKVQEMLTQKGYDPIEFAGYCFFFYNYKKEKTTTIQDNEGKSWVFSFWHNPYDVYFSVKGAGFSKSVDIADISNGH